MPILQFFRQNSAWLGAGVLLAFMSSFGQTFFISIFLVEDDFAALKGCLGYLQQSI